MAQLNVEKLKYLRKREKLSTAFIICAAVVLVGAIVCYSVAGALDYSVMKTVALAAGLPLLALCVAFAAFFNLKYSPAADALFNAFILDTLTENVEKLHTEKESLLYTVSVDKNIISLVANNAKEGITFDFTPLGKLSAGRRLYAVSALENRLCSFFCRLVARGKRFKEVSFVEINSARNKRGKPYFIVKDGLLNNKALKRHLKSRSDYVKA